MASGGYEPVAEKLLGAVDVDAFFLEYDSPRAGDFAPLRFLPKGKLAVLGLVSSKTAELEPKDAVKRRIDEAARHAAFDSLCLSPQCGFASVAGGNALGEDDQRRKLALVVEVARATWGSA
jgi:5-methyltetrahydropteroyltriglutamate--homocysteine methyltransferase